jgi:hypothetical protein
MLFPMVLKKSKNMSNNIFSRKRFALLCRQHIIHQTSFLLLSTVAYIGGIFVILSVAQVGNSFRPHNLESFQGFLIAFVAVFGVLNAGHAFPAFRNRESTINYLMVPASALEKFFLEFLSRVCITILMLPLLYWATFHLQGYFFNLFTDRVFDPIELRYLVNIEMTEPGVEPILLYTSITAAVVLALVLAFMGAAIFNKQPLVKTLFAVALVVMCFTGYIYIVVEHLDVGRYNPPGTMFLLPRNEANILRFLSAALIVTNIVMLFVAFRKLKEREV